MVMYLYGRTMLAKEYMAVLSAIREAVLHSGAAQLAEYKAEQAKEADSDCGSCTCGHDSPDRSDGAPQLLRDLLAADTVNDTDRRVFVCKAAAAGYADALLAAHKKWGFSAEDIKAGVKSAADTGEMGAVAMLMKFSMKP